MTNAGLVAAVGCSLLLVAAIVGGCKPRPPPHPPRVYHLGANGEITARGGDPNNVGLHITRAEHNHTHIHQHNVS